MSLNLNFVKNVRNTTGGVFALLLITAPIPFCTHAQQAAVKNVKSAGEDDKNENSVEPPQRLFGTWTAKDVDVQTGEVRIRLTFSRKNKVTFLAWSDIPFVGQVRDLKGPFSVHGDTISSEAIREGKQAKFSFENDQLVLRFKSGKVVRFNRE